jgi:hypothetical protein
MSTRVRRPLLESADPSALQPKATASGSGLAVEHWNEIRRLGLVEHIGELEANGLTVVPPPLVGPPEFTERLREAILATVERRTGARPDIDEESAAVYAQGFGRQMFYLLFEDPVFQEAVLNPTALALATYLLGDSCILSNCLAGLKGPGGPDLVLHTDNISIPPPFPPYAQVCNVTWALTDYDEGNGSLHYVPGSHRFGRHPGPGEGKDQTVAVTAKAGSIIFWHGNTWHGATQRQNPGVRINLIVAMMRPYLRPQELYRENVTPAMLAAWPGRFATLVGQNVTNGWMEEGPKPRPGAGLPGLGHQYD